MIQWYFWIFCFPIIFTVWLHSLGCYVPCKLLWVQFLSWSNSLRDLAWDLHWFSYTVWELLPFLPLQHSQCPAQPCFVSCLSSMVSLGLLPWGSNYDQPVAKAIAAGTQVCSPLAGCLLLHLFNWQKPVSSPVPSIALPMLHDPLPCSSTQIRCWPWGRLFSTKCYGVAVRVWMRQQTKSFIKELVFQV